MPPTLQSNGPNGPYARSGNLNAERAGIATADVSLHTLRHTALSRMIASGFDDYTVMSISGHSSTRILARFTHPTEERKLGALTLRPLVTDWSRTGSEDVQQEKEAEELKDLLGKELVDGARIELAASALRTRRSPS